MTVEDALMVIRSIPQFIWDQTFCDSERNALGMAVEALEKQIKKKPNGYHVRAFGADRIAYYCPSCKYCFTMMKPGKSDCRNQFCNICGEAIDWSEVEE